MSIIKKNNYIIYLIKCNLTGLLYVGSTTKTIKERLKKHERAFKRWQNKKKSYITSFNIIKNNNYNIYKIESGFLNNKKDILKRERVYIEGLTCVNKNKPTITKEEKKEYKKEHYKQNKDKYKENYKENKEKYKENFKEYYKANKDKLKEYNKKYYKANKAKAKEYYKQYREANKERLKEYYKKYYKAKNKTNINQP